MKLIDMIEAKAYQEQTYSRGQHEHEVVRMSDVRELIDKCFVVQQYKSNSICDMCGWAECKCKQDRDRSLYE